MTTYREKFLEAENQANQLAGQLAKLKEETLNYREAGESLTKSQEKIADLVSELELVLIDQRELIDVLREIGTEEIINTIDSNISSMSKELTLIQEQNEVHRAISQRMLIFVYACLALIVIVGVLVVVIK